MAEKRIRNLNPEEIECRVGAIMEQGITLLLYKNARVDQTILDEVFGICGWQRRHNMIGNELYCILSIWDDEKKQWVQKEDVGTESEYEKAKGAASDSIMYLIKYMENNYTQKLTLDYLAEFACMNKYYLSKEFKKYTGFSPNDYLISLRINRAKQLLEGTTLPASKIAHEIGIHDINNFTNLFKKKTGLTPIQYRHCNKEIL